MSAPSTTSQTVGPYFSIGFKALNRNQLAGPEVLGERITIHGRVLDGQGLPVPDAVVEIWQADADGKYWTPSEAANDASEKKFFGFGRIGTMEDGSFRFSTIKPGRVPSSGHEKQAPHIVVSVFMRGLLARLVTRIYFLNEPGNEQDTVLQLVDPARRSTLMAKPVAGKPGHFEWNVLLQGENETVFFDF
jgi:protocatechuate 3,4-dioxygenase, alpha subunit